MVDSDRQDTYSTRLSPSSQRNVSKPLACEHPFSHSETRILVSFRVIWKNCGCNLVVKIKSGAHRKKGECYTARSLQLEMKHLQFPSVARLFCTIPLGVGLLFSIYSCINPGFSLILKLRFSQSGNKSSAKSHWRRHWKISRSQILGVWGGNIFEISLT